MDSPAFHPAFDEPEAEQPVAVAELGGGDETTEDEAQPEERVVDEVALAMVENLGMAWGTFALYPNPANQPAWERAMAALIDLPGYPVFAEVGTGEFTSSEGAIEASREGAARLVKRLFLHDVAAIELLGPPRSDELIKLFEALSEDDEALRAQGGPRAMLINAGVESIAIVQRTMLQENEDIEELERETEVQEALQFVGDPEALASELMEKAGHDPDRLAPLFSGQYERVMGLVQPEDHDAREDLVQVFVEAFFYLPDDFQVPLLGDLVGKRAKPEFEVFLDQFSGHDLARLVHLLPEPVQEGLFDYARVDQAADSRPHEMLELLESAMEVEEARRHVAGRIGELLGSQADEGIAATFEHIAPRELQNYDETSHGYTVLRNLLAIEDRDLRFRRLMRVWSGKVVRSIRHGDLTAGAAWLDAVLVEPTYDPTRQSLVDETIAGMAGADSIESLVASMSTAPDDPGLKILELWGAAVIDSLIERLADEEDAGRRRVLISLLAQLSSRDSTSLLRHLHDPRWFVVRNLVTVLGKTGRPDAAPRLQNLAEKHEDHRVRVEALRSLMPLGGARGIDAALVALRDDNERVRQAAVTLLATTDSDAIDERLAAAVVDSSIPVKVRLKIVDALGGRSTEASRSALEAVARRRVWFGSGKQLRAHARSVMGESS